MLRKTALIAILFLNVLPALAQSELNAFKYIIIPKKYDFLKSENQFRLNSYTKQLFDGEGYATLVQGETYPEEVRANPCIAVTADVVNESNAFTTKLSLVLKNCYDQVVFTSIQGKSKIKQYDKSYKEALERCFVSVKALDHKYDPSLLINQNSGQKANAVVVPVASTNKQVAEPVAEATKVAEPVKVTEPVKAVETEAAVPVAVAAVPVVAKETKPDDIQESETGFAVAKSYKNENMSFFLIEQNKVLVAYVIESKNENFKKGETIGTFEKTSLPNVYRVAWKKDQGIDQTTAYFDEKGNLKIDVHRDGKIEVITFTEEK
jgi:hypothetical protein